MTDMYQVADGYNNAGALATIVPQPACEGVTAERITEMMDRSVVEDGFSHAPLKYSALTDTQYSTLLTLFGLTGTTRSNQVTLRLKVNATRAFANFNAIIRRMEDPAYKSGFWTDVIFDVSITEAL